MILSIQRKGLNKKLKLKKEETLKNVFDGFVRRLKFFIDMNGDTFKQKLLVANKALTISFSFKNNCSIWLKK